MTVSIFWNCDKIFLIVSLPFPAFPVDIQFVFAVFQYFGQGFAAFLRFCCHDVVCDRENDRHRQTGADRDDNGCVAPVIVAVYWFYTCRFLSLLEYQQPENSGQGHYSVPY